jgi:hypothetical protein
MTEHPAARLAVGVVVRDVDRSRPGSPGTSPRRARVVEQVPVGVHDFGWIATRLDAQAHAGTDEEVKECLRVAADQALGQRRRLGEKRPVPVAQREGRVGSRPDLPGRDDVEHREPRRPVGIIERHPVGNATAAVVTRDGKAVEAERGHRLDLVKRHRPLAVRRVVRRGAGRNDAP